MDDDGNGAVDCADSACSTTPACTPETCGNNIDDDGDGRFDCADSDCAEDPSCGGAKCGNASIDPGEDCDGANLGGRTCITQGFKTGVLACKSCAIDTELCSNDVLESCTNHIDDDGDGKADCADEDCAGITFCLCGNGVLDPVEQCDGELFPEWATCESSGFPGGTPTCVSSCQVVDTSTCTQPECGDGTTSFGEECDDGNVVSGDGCDATCRVELDQFCAATLPLVLGNNQGDTTGGSNALSGLCTGSGGRERVYSFTPAFSGQLTFVLISSTDMGLYVRSECDNADSELGCADHVFNGGTEALTVQVTAGQPLSVIIDSWGGGGAESSGPFTLVLLKTS